LVNSIAKPSVIDPKSLRTILLFTARSRALIIASPRLSRDLALDSPRIPALLLFLREPDHFDVISPLQRHISREDLGIVYIPNESAYAAVRDLSVSQDEMAIAVDKDSALFRSFVAVPWPGKLNEHSAMSAITVS
jgi:hypothetical protein